MEAELGCILVPLFLPLNSHPVDTYDSGSTICIALLDSIDTKYLHDKQVYLYVDVGKARDLLEHCVVSILCIQNRNVKQFKSVAEFGSHNNIRKGTFRRFFVSLPHSAKNYCIIRWGFLSMSSLVTGSLI